MQIAIVHSHLNPGGVTRIIESQLESLKGDSIKVVVGDCPEKEKIISKGAELYVFPAINYLEHRNYNDDEVNKLLKKITEYIEELLTEQSVLHVHNLNLGKNPVMTYAVYKLAQKGYMVFNHAHDFAEDRPANLQFLKDIIEGNFKEKLNDVLYPDFRNYHFGVLNSFDQKRLINYGVKEDKILWLPNPVTFNTNQDIPNKKGAKTEICKRLEIDKNKLLVTYPVRVIQRKNIGELILLAVLFADTINFIVTQPPKNPVEVELYKKWLIFCKEKNIQITFEAGNKVDFERLLIASDFCITTSYKEGFGMVYLEPWLLNTPVVGRNINFLTDDFKKEGFNFSALYDVIKIPGYPDDFKNFKMKTQMQVISEILSGQIKRHMIFEQNPALETLFNKIPKREIENNISIIKNNYSIKEYGTKLQNRYKKMVG